MIIDTIVGEVLPEWLPREVQHDTNRNTSTIRVSMFGLSAAQMVDSEIQPAYLRWLLQELLDHMMPRIINAADIRLDSAAFLAHLRGLYTGKVLAAGRAPSVWESGEFYVPVEKNPHDWFAEILEPQSEVHGGIVSAPIRRTMVHKGGENVIQPYAYFDSIDRLALFDHEPIEGA